MYKWKRIYVNVGTLTVPLKAYQLLWNIWRICSKSELKNSGRGRKWWGCRNYPCYKKWQKLQKKGKKEADRCWQVSSLVPGCFYSHLTHEFLSFITIKERMKQLSFKAIPKPFTCNSKHLAHFRKKSYYSSVSLQLKTGSSHALFARYNYISWHKTLDSLLNHHRTKFLSFRSYCFEYC